MPPPTKFYVFYLKSVAPRTGAVSFGKLGPYYDQERAVEEAQRITTPSNVAAGRLPPDPCTFYAGVWTVGNWRKGAPMAEFGDIQPVWNNLLKEHS